MFWHEYVIFGPYFYCWIFVCQLLIQIIMIIIKLLGSLNWKMDLFHTLLLQLIIFLMATLSVYV
jgi:hypothetical protein